MTESVLELTGATFDEEVAASAVPVLVEVGAQWCPPCRLMAPVLRAVAAEHGDRLRVLSLDADDHPEVVSRFGVRSLPTMLVFRDGQLAGRMVGARAKARLLEELADLLR
jgi:thioredoxin 1